MNWEIIHWTWGSKKPLKLRTTIKRQRKYYLIGGENTIYLEESQWKDGVVRDHPNAGLINIELLRIKDQIEKKLLTNKIISPQEIENILNPQKVIATPAVKIPSLIEFAQQYHDDCKKGIVVNKKTTLPLADSYVRAINVSVERLRTYEKMRACAISGEAKPLTFEDVHSDFRTDLVNFLRYDGNLDDEGNAQGYMENSIAKTIDVLKIIMRHAKGKKLHSNEEFQNFVVSYSVADSLVLSPEKMRAIINADLSERPDLVAEQERFSLAYNFLLRFGDTIRINKHNIISDSSGKFLRITTTKTNQEVIIPITAKNYAILKKRKFTIDGTTNQQSNRNLKELGLFCEMNDERMITEVRKGVKERVVYKEWQLMSTHLTRRCGATHLRLAGVPLERIMLIGGWRKINQVMDYIRLDKLENAIDLAKLPFFK